MSYNPLEEIEKLVDEFPNDQKLGEEIRKWFAAIKILREIAVKNLTEALTGNNF